MLVFKQLFTFLKRAVPLVQSAKFAPLSFITQVPVLQPCRVDAFLETNEL
jgi:hypothetical protein